MQNSELFKQNWQIISNKKLGDLNCNELFTFNASNFTVFKVTTDMNVAKTVEVLDNANWKSYKFVLPIFLDVQVVTHKH